MTDLDTTPRPTAFGRNRWMEVLQTDRKVAPEWPMKVSAAKWNRLDAKGRKAAIDDHLRKNSPRLEVTSRGRGSFAARGKGITSFRLLLTEDMLSARGEVVLKWNGRTLRETPRLSKRVLLRDFAERFDRTRLPVAECVVR